MKNILKTFILLVLVAAYSCESYEGAFPDLSDTYPAYVEISNTSAITVPEGGTATVNLSSRILIETAYTVSWEVSGAFTASGTVDIEAGVNEASFTVPVDAGIVTSGDAVAATVTLTSATNDMAVGRNGINNSVELNVTKFVPFVNTDYAITFDCDEPGYAVYPTAFVTTGDPLVLTNTNFWDSGWSVDYTFSGDFDQIVTIEEQDISGNIVTGSGTYDGVTKTMVVAYKIVGADGAVRDNSVHTFTVPAS